MAEVRAFAERAEEVIRRLRPGEVVTVGGRLVPGHEAEHARRLRAEGVRLHDGKVRLRGTAPDP